jgi:ribosome small subunit-dependent GTPase A
MLICAMAIASGVARHASARGCRSINLRRGKPVFTLSRKIDKSKKEALRLQKLLAAQAKPKATEAGEVNALVIGIGPGICTVDVDGLVRHVRCEIPVVPGDEVSVMNDGVSGIAPRRTILTRTDPMNERKERVIVANVDRMVIVAAVTNPPLRTGLIDRYMIAAARGGIQPILCVNKLDLSEDTTAVESYEIPIIRCSTKTGEGIDELRDLLAGSMAALVGHSGVGKSSLLNALTGEDQARVGALNEDTGKGTHTTTASRLYHLKNGARIIDTPGIREFGLGPVSVEELKAAFPEFIGSGCRFKDCTHKEEPDCAIRSAGGPRYEAWLRLLELADHPAT